ncbi:hypothetical protein PV04_05367 [Phialophora macrospora]|uniref:Carboxypeptidase n=1 Tax=Phialophora macrospora TaxID=1851006 RepID=A0A0D2GBS7_9EURO|nr:hypothetical protein PV04_05367 [Phialophora macrospora]
MKTTICGVNTAASYAGYIKLPGRTWSNPATHDINLFYWFFEAQEVNPREAPFVLWLSGGPGASSLLALFQENGPCSINSDSNSTTENYWSWNRNANMLYIDQPVQTGLSFDNLDPGLIDLLTGRISTTEDSLLAGDRLETKWNLMPGVFSSQKPENTAKTSQQAAEVVWHSLNAWFKSYPRYRPANGTIHLFTESYGGHYGPIMAKMFQSLNERNRMSVFEVGTLTIINGCIDTLVQDEAYATFPLKNTYGLELYNISMLAEAEREWKRCKKLTAECRRVRNPNLHNNDADQARGDICLLASKQCLNGISRAYAAASGRNWFDICQQRENPFPSPYLIGFLNREWVRDALGVRLNFTMMSNVVREAFEHSGDYVQSEPLRDLGALLDSDVKVTLLYGDRDFACSWVGGERVSLSVPHKHADTFTASGYQKVESDGGTASGMVRQHNNLAFVRVFQAGHQVPAYQPEASYHIFSRIVTGMDIATGTIHVDTDYRTKGPESTWHVQLQCPAADLPQCYLLAPQTCTGEMLQALDNGCATVENWIVKKTTHESCGK